MQDCWIGWLVVCNVLLTTTSHTLASTLSGMRHDDYMAHVAWRRYLLQQAASCGSTAKILILQDTATIENQVLMNLSLIWDCGQSK
jgi:hypothetical protein